MLLPKGIEIPSETTIAVLSNHHILCLLASPHAWIMAPTTNQERDFGYDANLRGVKAALIQYKRQSRVNVDGGFSVSIDPSQHSKLTCNFPALAHPYVFYAFSRHSAYHIVANDYERIGSPQFMASMVFIDAHVVPAQAKTLRAFLDRRIRAHAGGRVYSSPIHGVDGLKFISGLRRCDFGERADAISEVAGEDFRVDTEPPRELHYFLWKMDGAR